MSQTYTQGGQNIAGQFGLPLFGVATLPPYTGNWFWVDETNGSDGNTGGPQDPLKTLSQAHSVCTSGNNDVVVFTGTIHQTASLAWSKNNTHLIGLDAPLKRGKRARISVSGSTAFSPLINVTASGCHFKNFGTFSGFTTDALATSYCLSDTGGRNCYENVEILGFGGTGTAGNTGARAAFISGSTGENTFRDCVFGVDTVTRGVANYTLEFAAAGPRHHFANCEFEMDASAATPAHIFTAASNAIDRYARFDNCVFRNATGSGATTINQVAKLAASAGGTFELVNCNWWGATHLETTTTNQIVINNPVTNQTDPGLMKNNS